jgi:hypothetical protein
MELLIAGTYVFRLTATDNAGATGTDDVNVVVTINTAPVANAGADKSIALPTNSVVITGSGTDTNGTIASYAWTRQSGPNIPTLSGASTSTLIVSGLIAGTYVYRLTVTDNGGLTAFDDVNIVVTNATATNLALNKTTTVSSTENVGTPGSGAVDGNLTTRWSSAFSDPQWLYVDLGSNYAVNRVKITWEGAYGKDYLVQISTNTTTWTTIKTVTGNTTLANDHTGLSGTGKYVRIYGTARGTTYGYSIYELEVYGTTAVNVAPTANAGMDKGITLPTSSVVVSGSGTDSDGTIASYAWTRISGPNTPTLSGASTATLTVSGLIVGTYVYRLTVADNGGLTATDDVNIAVTNATTTNLALNKTTTVSSTEAAGTPESSAVDGNLTTRWSSAFSDPQWIYVDLGATYSVNRVKITWEAAYGKDYLVQLSTNTTTWTTLKTVTGNTSLINDHTGLSGSGRYIRVYGTARGTVYGYSIYELEVYGASSARLALPDVQDEAKAEDVVVGFYPNPVDNILQITGMKGDPMIMIHSTTGGEAFLAKLNNGSIDISELPAGIYILNLPYEGKPVRHKLIKK